LLITSDFIDGEEELGLVLEVVLEVLIGGDDMELIVSLFSHQKL
jgi:hypothetical protein